MHELNISQAIKADAQYVNLLQKVEWLSQYSSIWYCNCCFNFNDKNDEIEMGLNQREEENLLCEANFIYKSEGKEMILEYRGNLKNIGMCEEMFNEFNRLLDEKKRSEVEKLRNEKIDSIYDHFKNLKI